MLFAIVEIAKLLLSIATWIIIIQVVLSWLFAFNVLNTNSGGVRAFTLALERITAPIYRPIRRILPDFGGIDFGTSNSTAAVFGQGGPRLVALEDQHVAMPSAVFFNFENERTYFGRQANEEYTANTEGRLLRALPVASAAVVTLAGLAITAGALVQAGVVRV